MTRTIPCGVASSPCWATAKWRDKGGSARRAAGLEIVIASILVVVPLGITSYTVVMNSTLQQQGSSAVATWLTGSGYHAISVAADKGHISANIGGDGPVPPMATLLADLRRQGASATVSVSVYPEQTLSGSTTP